MQLVFFERRLPLSFTILSKEGNSNAIQYNVSSIGPRLLLAMIPNWSRTTSGRSGLQSIWLVSR